jgi:hypothetical protein
MSGPLGRQASPLVSRAAPGGRMASPASRTIQARAPRCAPHSSVPAQSQWAPLASIARSPQNSWPALLVVRLRGFHSHSNDPAKAQRVPPGLCAPTTCALRPSNTIYYNECRPIRGTHEVPPALGVRAHLPLVAMQRNAVQVQGPQRQVISVRCLHLLSGVGWRGTMRKERGARVVRTWTDALGQCGGGAAAGVP